MNIQQKIKMARRAAVLSKRKPGGGSNVSQSRPAVQLSNPPSYDKSDRYSITRLGLSLVGAHGRVWQQGGKPRGKVIPSTQYNPRPKAPSLQDWHRMKVAERKAA